MNGGGSNGNGNRKPRRPAADEEAEEGGARKGGHRSNGGGRRKDAADLIVEVPAQAIPSANSWAKKMHQVAPIVDLPEEEENSADEL